MTRVEAQYELAAPPDDRLLEAIGRLHSIYGIHQARLTQQMDSLLVIYDASRLTPLEVDAALRRAGIRATRREPQTA